MLKKCSPLAALVVLLLCLSVSAQKIAKPTLVPTEATAAQKAVINEGIKFHDQGLYDEAIAKYDEVLKENPTCSIAMYEKTLSLYYKKDFEKALALAYEGAKYKSTDLPQFYGVIANIYDDQGNPQKAVDLYKQGIEMLGSDTEFKASLSSLYYNLAITNFRQKQYAEAKDNAKKAIAANPVYASPHFLLAQLYNGTGYKIPALLAGMRFISLEANTGRTKNTAALVKEIGGGNVKRGENGNINIFINPAGPKDEGDFSAVEMMTGLLGASGELEKNKGKDEIELFADGLGTMIGFVVSDKKIGNTFVGKNYVPFLAEIKTRGYVKPLAAIVLHQSGNTNATAYLKNNQAQALEFLNWAKNFR